MHVCHHTHYAMRGVWVLAGHTWCGQSGLHHAGKHTATGPVEHIVLQLAEHATSVLSAISSVQEGWA